MKIDLEEEEVRVGVFVGELRPRDQEARHGVEAHGC